MARKMIDRIQHAWRVAAPPSLVVAVLCGLGAVSRRPRFNSDPRGSVAVVAGLTLVVFLTYFLFVLLGFKSSSPGAVDAPRIYTWPAVFVILLLVFGTLFFLLPGW